MVDACSAISICIPSYRRSRSLARLLRQISAATPASSNILVRVINDSGAADETLSYEAILGEFSNLNIELVHHEQNKGYARTFLELIQSASTEYILFLADDDDVDFSFWNDILKFLATEQPDICSTQFLIDGKIYRGRSSLQKASPKSCIDVNGHAPGVIYRASSMGFVAQLRGGFTA